MHAEIAKMLRELMVKLLNQVWLLIVKQYNSIKIIKITIPIACQEPVSDPVLMVISQQ